MKREPITGELAKRVPRFDFIAHYLVVVTAKKENRGPLGYRVRRVGGEWRVLAGETRHTIVYATREADRLYEFARRTELGHYTREADLFREEAYLA